ncbi:UDP-N-acetylglucosamine--N-acetylmuramyl-(pentapeptide) pyrophosphoryl-undecaprenol N-acetylglucosamine transferase [Candidatus Parcubacteria bacterium]|nr:UDP-N-acetylglucosamine--N-acetylmuramyl-(pentapeptide) pyrophosphoryl-undecaprenol N-acetylglucosamine transferase [Candidatus Parcubacteria bacterium]
MNKTAKIVFTGGGTMGHIFPLVSVIRELRVAFPNPNLKLNYFWPKHPKGNPLLEDEGVKIKHVLSGKIRRYFDFKNFIDFFKTPVGFLQAFCLLFFKWPDLIIATGGYGSFPVCLAGFFLRVPIILLEADVEPGLASKIIAKFASQIFTAFPNTLYFSKQKTICLGNPIRRSLLEGSAQKAKMLFNLKGDKPVLLILGGSLGSRNINNLILEILLNLIKNFEIIHQAGEEKFGVVEMEAKAYLKDQQLLEYHCLPFLNEEQLKQSLAIADFVISRAGSGALFELASTGKPSLLIPLPNSAQNHQVKNAYKLADHGGAYVVEEENLKPNFFLQRFENIALNEETKKIMRQNALKFARPEAGSKIAKFVLEFLGLV